MSREDCMASTFWLRARNAKSATPSAALQFPHPLTLQIGVGVSDRERNRLASLRGVDDSHIDLLALCEVRYAGRPEDRDVDEDVFAAVFTRHEAEALGVVKPFDMAGD